MPFWEMRLCRKGFFPRSRKYFPGRFTGILPAELSRRCPEASRRKPGHLRGIFGTSHRGGSGGKICFFTNQGYLRI